MHLLILDANAGTGTGHSLSYAGILAEGAHRLGWDLTVVAPHPPVSVPMRFEPIAPSYVPGRSSLRNFLAQRAAVRRADALARSAGVDLIIDTYLHPALGFHAFRADSPPRVRVLHHTPHLRRHTARRVWLNWQQASVADLRALVAAGDVFAVHAEAGVEALRALVPGVRVVAVANPMRLGATLSQHAPRDVPHLAFLGEPRADKGWPELLAALPHVTVPLQIRAITAGAVDLPASSVGVVEIVHVADVADHAAFQRAVADADGALVVHTSAFGGRQSSSATLLEVLAAGLPAVCGEVVTASLPDDPVAYRVVDPCDPLALAAALDKLALELGAARAAAQRTGPAWIRDAHDAALTLHQMAEAAGVQAPS